MIKDVLQLLNHQSINKNINGPEIDANFLYPSFSAFLHGTKLLIHAPNHRRYSVLYGREIFKTNVLNGFQKNCHSVAVNKFLFWTLMRTYQANELKFGTVGDDTSTPKSVSAFCQMSTGLFLDGSNVQFRQQISMQ